MPIPAMVPSASQQGQDVFPLGWIAMDSAGHGFTGRLGTLGAGSASREPDPMKLGHPEFHKLGLLRSLVFLVGNPFPSTFAIGLDHWTRLAVLA